jgi:pilus assembly protein Flp/PilA
MLKLISKVLRDERGVSAIEYSVLAGIVVVAVVAAGAALTTGDNSLSNVFSSLMTKVSNAQQSS